MNIDILFEDQDLLIINKPAGVVVNDAQTIPGAETLQSWFWQRLQEGQNSQVTEADFGTTADSEVDSYQTLIPTDYDSSWGDPEAIFAERRGMVHRLDKETSGVLVFAKNPGALVNLLAQFKKRLTHKKYTCLVHGRFGVAQDVISFPIARSTQDRTKFRVDISGREATTQYQVVQFYPELDLAKLEAAGLSAGELKLLRQNRTTYQGFSLVECWPQTGRTHQIRVHLAHIKHPLVGDKLYVGKKRKKLDILWCRRHFLHASQLILTHPRTGQNLTMAAPLPNDLAKCLSILQN